MRKGRVHTMTVIRQWVLMLGGAGLLCGVAQCLMPSKAMEKQLRLQEDAPREPEAALN